MTRPIVGNLAVPQTALTRALVPRPLYESLRNLVLR